MGTAAECTNCHVLPSVELNLTKAKFIRGRVNSPYNSPVCLFTLLDASIDRHFALSSSILSKLEVSRKRLYGLHIPWMYVICSEVRFVEISSPNECDKILKIRNEQTEPTDYMANCSTDEPHGQLDTSMGIRCNVPSGEDNLISHMPLLLPPTLWDKVFQHSYNQGG